MVRERMGSGGPRGLQIPRSGASCVRGGFDSHAFPPLIAALLFGLGALVLPASVPRAQPVPADTTARQAPPVAADTTAERAPRTVPRRRWSDQPRWVMARSLLVPGWGQLANRAWFKAALVAGIEGTVAVKLLDDRRALDRLQDEIGRAGAAGDEAGYADAVNRYNARLDSYVGRQWLLGGAVLYALIDAYVDANFRGFDVEFKADPALPGASPPAFSARLSYRWTF